MPFSCAKAICATFCHHIAPALVPIFGPDFPSICVSPDAPEHGRMIIDRSITITATAEAEVFRRQQPLAAQSNEEVQYSTVYNSSRRLTPTLPVSKLRAKRIQYNATSPDLDNSDYSSSDGRCSQTDSPVTPSSYTSISNVYNWSAIKDQHNTNTIAHNQNSKIGVDLKITNLFAYPYGNINSDDNNHTEQVSAPNSILPTIPRSNGVMYVATLPVSAPSPSAPPDGGSIRFGTLKRRLPDNENENLDEGSAYEDRARSHVTISQNASKYSSATSLSSHAVEGVESDSVSDQGAAWLLLNLSASGGAPSINVVQWHDQDMPCANDVAEQTRVKRRRASSV